MHNTFGPSVLYVTSACGRHMLDGITEVDDVVKALTTLLGSLTEVARDALFKKADQTLKVTHKVRAPMLPTTS